MIFCIENISIKGSNFCIEILIFKYTNFVLNFVDSKNTTKGNLFILGRKRLVLRIKIAISENESV